ncbi:MAG: Rpn family recombination-promoting nuclease/putative transposase [Eubacteriales bacterium]|nr:Rpn family recombination-promoting nuclease/putative transposase [Eubacteriales bacterium]
MQRNLKKERRGNIRGSHAKTDIILKNFWEQNDRFADVFNAALFGGKPVIVPERLETADTDVSGVIRLKGEVQSLARIRDVVKKSVMGVDFMLLGLESQGNVHYAMPLRSMLYDGLSYLKECRGLSRRMKREKNSRSPSSDEFLSGMRKEDRLHPVITLVIYYGEKNWDGPLSLRDMVMEMPKEVEELFVDYRLHLLQVGESERCRFQNEEVKAVFELSREIFRGNFRTIEEKYKEKYISPEVLTVVGKITESEELMAQGKKGEVHNVCTALENLEMRCREEGYSSGVQENVQKLYRKGFPKENISELLEIPMEKVEEYCREDG